MMSVYADAFVALISLSLLLTLFYGPWQTVVTDWARQIAIEARDEVFDMARAGLLDFNSDEYAAIRRSFNSLIRFAHEFSWMTFIVHYESTTSSEKTTFDKSLDAIGSAEVREKVRRLMRRTRIALIVMMAAKSFPIFLLALVAGAVAYLMGSWRRVLFWLDHFIGHKVQAEAEGAK